MPYIAFIVYTLVLLKSSYCWEFVKDWQIAICLLLPSFVQYRGLTL